MGQIVIMGLLMCWEGHHPCWIPTKNVYPESSGNHWENPNWGLSLTRTDLDSKMAVFKKTQEGLTSSFLKIIYSFHISITKSSNYLCRPQSLSITSSFYLFFSRASPSTNRKIWRKIGHPRLQSPLTESCDLTINKWEV